MNALIVHSDRDSALKEYLLNNENNDENLEFEQKEWFKWES